MKSHSLNLFSFCSSCPSFSHKGRQQLPDILVQDGPKMARSLVFVTNFATSQEAKLLVLDLQEEHRRHYLLLDRLAEVVCYSS